MKVRLGHNDFREPTVIDAVESVLIHDDYGNPIIVVQKLAEGQIMVVKANEVGFNEVLKDYGVGLQAKVIMK